jgi:(p)ppGpp synthase/HD superfamily hydrolase
VYSKDEIEKKLFAIVDKKETYTQFIRSVYPKEVAMQREKESIGPKVVQQDLKQFKDTLAVVIDGDMVLDYHFCPECKPQISDKIIARTGKD